MKYKNIKIGLFVLILVLTSLVFVDSIQATDSLFYFSWESNGSTSADYQGKSLAVVGSIVKVSLQPLVYDSGYSNPSGWNFRWSVDGNFRQEGAGLSNFRFIPDIYSNSGREYTITAEVQFPNGLKRVEEVVIPVVSPKVVLRVDGESERRDGLVDVVSEEVSLGVEGYFFSAKHLPLIARWYIDGSYQYNNRSKVISIQRSDFIKERKVEVILESKTDSLVRGIGKLNLNFY